MGLSCFCPAKLNLSLRVIGRRKDGYHELDMLNVCLTFGDTLELVEFQAGSNIEVVLHCSGDTRGLPEHSSNNLIVRLLKTLADFVPSGRYVFSLQKNIPVGSGLGGGSSNAAAALRLALASGTGRMSLQSLAKGALAVGSDVPYLLDMAPARVSGLGECVQPLGSACAEKLIGKEVLLLLPEVSLPTPAVFASYRERGAAFSPPSSWPLEGGSLPIANDLLTDALRLAPALRPLAELLGQYDDWGMSGSGSTFFLWNPAEGVAEEVGARLAGLARAERALVLSGTEQELFPLKHLTDL